ncbi:unnamed protein product, partial [Mesorhabditis spiculigera]
MYCAAYCSATGGRCFWMQTYFECSCKDISFGVVSTRPFKVLISLQLSELPTPILMIVLTVIMVAISLLVAIMIWGGLRFRANRRRYRQSLACSNGRKPF